MVIKKMRLVSLLVVISSTLLGTETKKLLSNKKNIPKSHEKNFLFSQNVKKVESKNISKLQELNEKREEQEREEQEINNIFIAQLMSCFCWPCLLPLWTCSGYEHFIEDSRGGNCFDGW